MGTRTIPVRPPANEGGFTLLEAVIAMAVLAFGVLTVCMMQSSALRASTTAYNRTEANNVSAALVEALQQLPFSHPALEATPSYNNLSGCDAWPLEDGNNTDKWPRTVHVCGELGQEVYNPGSSYKNGALAGDTTLRCLPDGDKALKQLLQDRVITISDSSGCSVKDSKNQCCEVMDRSGITYLVKMGVQDVNLETTKDASGKTRYITTDKRIRIHMEWNTPAGVNHLEYTANKFKNETGSTEKP